ncbi:MAG: TRIC cation channel family protein [Clostridia bacterium]|nr:TRIC cation channel family protein [Clostridia bacterium]
MEIIDVVFYVAEIIGIIAFALSGAMIAIDRGLDLFGVVFLTVINSFGGGIMRDLIIGEIPPKMFYSFEYLLYAGSCAVIVMILAAVLKEKFFRNRVAIDRVINIFDAIGLGTFAIVGVRAGITAGYGANVFLCVFLGMTTGIGGGILRDLLSREKPLVLVKQIYAIAAIAGAILYYYMQRFNINNTVSIIIPVLLVVLIRICASHFRWDLPKVGEEINGNNKKHK